MRLIGGTPVHRIDHVARSTTINGATLRLTRRSLNRRSCVTAEVIARRRK